MTTETTLTKNLERVQLLATRCAGVGALLMIAGFLFDREQFYQSYLFAYLAWLAPSDRYCLLLAYLSPSTYLWVKVSNTWGRGASRR